MTSCVSSSQLDYLLDLFICSEDKLQSFQHSSSSPQIFIKLMESSLKTSSQSSKDAVEKKCSFKLEKDEENPITHTLQQNYAYRDFYTNQYQSINKKQQEISINRQSSKWKDKNSNTIKKIGRIILDHLSQYDQFQEKNTSVKDMMELLSHSQNKVYVQQYKRRDRFNTQHLKQLFKPSNLKLMSFNLKKTQQLLCQYLRKVVMRSEQIKETSKLIYLNTMKCSALRCSNPKLAIRLQMSNQPK